jgi:hypothetical protein
VRNNGSEHINGRYREVTKAGVKETVALKSVFNRRVDGRKDKTQTGVMIEQR